MEPMDQYEHSRFQYLQRRRYELRQILKDIGISLHEIKSERLFRTEYQDFDDYCVNAWGLNPTFVAVLMEGAYDND